VIGRFPGETSCLSLVCAVLDLFFSHASNGATFTDLDLDRQHLYRIRYQPASPQSATLALHADATMRGLPGYARRGFPAGGDWAIREHHSAHALRRAIP